MLRNCNRHRPHKYSYYIGTLRHKVARSGDSQLLPDKPFSRGRPLFHSLPQLSCPSTNHPKIMSIYQRLFGGFNIYID